MGTGTLHAITIICHTVVLVAIVIAICFLANTHSLDSNALGAIAALGGVAGSGLVINGRKVPQPGNRAEDVPNRDS